ANKETGKVNRTKTQESKDPASSFAATDRVVSRGRTMKKYTDGPESGKLHDSSSRSSRQHIATREDLFPAVLKHVRRASLARTAAELLYWVQYAKHEFKGRIGMYKEDEELGKALGMHPKTAGRHVAELCAAGSKNQPGKLLLFDVAYGPKPGAGSGRSRWLFPLPEAHKIIEEALEEKRLRQERAAPTNRNAKSRPRGAHHSNRSPQNAPTLISHPYLTEKPSEGLSKQAEKGRGPTDSKREESQGKIEVERTEMEGDVSEQVNRLMESWRRVCERSNKPDLVWPDQELDRLSSKLAKTVADLRLHKISDADLDARLTVLCTKLPETSRDMSEAFADYNRRGLELSSFVQYGHRLMKLAPERAPQLH